MLTNEYLEWLRVEYNNDERIVNVVNELMYYKKRYAFQENQKLCVGYNGQCDGDLEGTEHEVDCPARIQDLEIRPYLYVKNVNGL